MIYIGIDVAKDKHDCFITNSDGEILFNPFTISNNREGFETLFQRIKSVAEDFSKIKVGLEATGHYSYNLLGFLLDKGLPTYVINPLHKWIIFSLYVYNCCTVNYKYFFTIYVFKKR